MATFTNVAQLSFNGSSVLSNVVTGTILEAISGAKRASQRTYTRGDKITYVITMNNTSAVPINTISVSDDLGEDTYSGQVLVPMDFEAGSVQLYINNVPVANPAIQAGPPLVISGFTLPVNGTATLVYNTVINNNAPLAEGSSITNTAAITSPTLAAPIVFSDTIDATQLPQLTVEKQLTPLVVDEDGPITYTFVIRNTGNRATIASDAVTLTDTFAPPLTIQSVTYNGTPWVQNTNYTYSNNVFTSLPNQITVPAATYTRAADGSVLIAPGTAVLTVTGTI